MRERDRASSAVKEFESLLPQHNPYRVLIVDDHAVVRRGLRSILEGHPGVDVMESSTGADAIEMVKALKPHLALVDLTMPIWTGWK